MDGKKLYKIHNIISGEFLIQPPHARSYPSSQPNGTWGTYRGGRIWYKKDAAIAAKARLPAEIQNDVEVIEYEMVRKGVVG